MTEKIILAPDVPEDTPFDYLDLLSRMEVHQSDIDKFEKTRVSEGLIGLWNILGREEKHQIVAFDRLPDEIKKEVIYLAFITRDKKRLPAIHDVRGTLTDLQNLTGERIIP